jgi:uncharacterized membrane protein
MAFALERSIVHLNIGVKERIFMKWLFAVLAMQALSSGPALADLNFCNKTGSSLDVSVAYKGDKGWTSEGWWIIPAGKCAVTLPGDLQLRYYYYRAEPSGGPFFGGDTYFCTTPEKYTIVGRSNCKSRGYDREAFRRVDTGVSARSVSINLRPQPKR